MNREFNRQTRARAVMKRERGGNARGREVTFSRLSRAYRLDAPRVLHTPECLTRAGETVDNICRPSARVSRCGTINCKLYRRRLRLRRRLRKSIYNVQKGDRPRV